jgi:HEAT repeat protein
MLAPSWRWQRGSEPDEISIEHHGRRVQKALTGLDQLQRAGSISDADAAAALRFRRDYENGVLGARDPEAQRGAGGGGIPAYLAAIVDVTSRYRQAAQALGRHGDELLRGYVVEGLSIREMSRIFAEAGLKAWEAAGKVGPRPHSDAFYRRSIGADLTAALRTLSDHYLDVDTVGKRGLLPRRGRLLSTGVGIAAEDAS